MSEEVNIPNLQEYVSIKDAAKMLGLSYTTVHEYVIEGRIPAVRTSGMYLIAVEEVQNFKPNMSGRPRKSIPKWRISPEDNTLLKTLIVVQVRPDKHEALIQKLEEVKQSGQHDFPGTIARYIMGDEAQTEHIEILLIWRSSVMPDEAGREQALEAFRQALDDVLDWKTARYEHGTVYMHT
jgi:excisionase family DNA binding protein